MLDTLNHPIVFVFAMLLALWGLASVFTHIFKQLGWNGPASLMQTP